MQKTLIHRKGLFVVALVLSIVTILLIFDSVRLLGYSENINSDGLGAFSIHASGVVSAVMSIIFGFVTVLLFFVSTKQKKI